MHGVACRGGPQRAPRPLTPSGRLTSPQAPRNGQNELVAATAGCPHWAHSIRVMNIRGLSGFAGVICQDPFHRMVISRSVMGSGPFDLCGIVPTLKSLPLSGYQGLF